MKKISLEQLAGLLNKRFSNADESVEFQGIVQLYETKKRSEGGSPVLTMEAQGEGMHFTLKPTYEGNYRVETEGNKFNFKPLGKATVERREKSMLPGKLVVPLATMRGYEMILSNVKDMYY